MAGFTKEQLDKFKKLEEQVKKEPAKEWDEFCEKLEMFGWDPSNETDLKCLHALFLIEKYTKKDMASDTEFVDKTEWHEANLFERFFKSIMELFQKDNMANYPIFVKEAFECLEIVNNAQKEKKTEDQKDKAEENKIKNINSLDDSADDIDVNNINNDININRIDDINTNTNDNSINIKDNSEKQKDDGKRLSDFDQSKLDAFRNEYNEVKEVLPGVYSLSGRKKGERRRTINDDEFDAMGMREKGNFLLGSAIGWKKQMVKELNQYAQLLSETQKDKDANWASFGTEGPQDYIDVARSLQAAKNVLQKDNYEVKFDEMKKAMETFRSKLLRYESKHRPVFRDHTSAETAERYRLIEGMADLTGANLQVLKQLEKGVQITIRQVHTNSKYSVGNKPLADLSQILGVAGFGLKAGLERENFDPDEVRKVGEGMLPGMLANSQKQMLNERFERKTGLKTEAQRNALGYITVRDRTIHEYAKNYCSVKYRDELSEVRYNPLDVIDVNDKIRAKNFNKEVESLENDFYFKRILAKNRKDWGKKWEEVEAKSEDWLDDMRDDYIENEKSGGASFGTADQLAQGLIIKSLFDPKNKGALHAVADFKDNPKVMNAMVSNVEFYLTNLFPDLKGNNLDYKKKSALMKKLYNDSDLKSSVALRLEKSFFENVLFPKVDANAAQKSEQKVPGM